MQKKSGFGLKNKLPVDTRTLRMEHNIVHDTQYKIYFTNNLLSKAIKLYVVILPR